ncbi:MAG: hypothetical protein A2846_02825 [Candidatus Doudnabacteria bacterium RIFCSPHIGHO2_01_FULL_49_9]|uniref:ribose-phosphate diphosphokinase n=1 Tax=Candidatus Doudnabacteria bacterium RIFCSPHIGHO2_01_FULL_49_9 TaxID=1817827 RepID=A0A1F5P486_9BACT|nr:MAG: hypothetical protein A2846_02825 [Candidatus Doudnabacteria bacterium RIFCSPHIGHO2_01_FULL_49_9]
MTVPEQVNTIVLHHSATSNVAGELALSLGAPVFTVHTKRFPDGTANVRLPTEVRGKNVILVADTRPDSAIIKLLLLQAALQRGGAARIDTVIPYYAYARQDRRACKEDQPVAAEVFAQLIGQTTNRVGVVEPHNQSFMGCFGESAVSASPIREIAEHLESFGVGFVLAPDEGALPRAKEVAEILGVPFDHLDKKRVSPTEVRIVPKELKVQGLRVAVLDDMISGGDTTAAAITELKRQGADRVVAACVHGLFLGDALDKLRVAGCNRVVATNTVAVVPYGKVSCVPAIVRALQEGQK